MLNIPDSPYPRIVIIGAGFAGFTIAKKLKNKNFQVVLIDRNNFHQFQPLFYQVAMAGLEPSSIIYPLRKAFQKSDNIIIRIAEVEEINHAKKRLNTNYGDIYYDKLIIATGADTNYFGNKEIEKNTYSLKDISEALDIRNAILSDLETALKIEDYDERQGFIDIVIVGGGPTGVELAGALAEMKQYILPKDYKELDNKEVDIFLVQGGDRLLPGMSEKAGKKAKQFLDKLGVDVILDKRVVAYDGRYVSLNDDTTLKANKVIWAAGVKAKYPSGFPNEAISKTARLRCNDLNEVEGVEDIYAVGDVAIIESTEKPYGDPQVAQVAIQQAENLANNLIKQGAKPFVYKDYGSMATIGRNKAVADIGKSRFGGFFAWIIWLFIHVRALIGFKNKIIVLLNWVWNYLTYDQSLRVIISRGKGPHKK